MAGRDLARYDSAPTLKMLRLNRSVDEKELFDTKIRDTVNQITQMIKVVQPHLNGDQRAKLIQTIDQGHGFRLAMEEVGRIKYVEEKANLKAADASRRAFKEAMPQEPRESGVLFPYQSQTIMNRVKRLMTDVETIRGQVMGDDGTLFTDDQGRSTCSVRDLSSFVGAVHSLYTTVGNLETVDKVKGDLQSVTHAISEAILEIPSQYQDIFMKKFREVVRRINER